MKTLIVARHAKSSWDFPQLKDEDRPLLSKGKKRISKIILSLQKEKIARPGLIISSHAVRAFETSRIFASFFQYPENQIQVSQTVYYGNKDHITDLFYSIDDDIDSVMIVGHNPNILAFINQFLLDPLDGLPTSGVVILELPIESWTELAGAKASTIQKIFPWESNK
ncbi:MAG TPA: histidine phosphatase family protein [Bacteroidales bacterium]|mgnify:CR=1 FL=1|jgi:phosphohistidine phosphatase|nr:histidine phosphatase family protein [Bacteroidales bacterium]MDI9573787.1 histidine phosphatase family protein [Bacteroidota bacterium]OQC61293.1 MAG: Histidine phosphatase superfamily (branch 1) [Bacteroidetes bacterium ADurb.Bin012]MBP9511102.1 histidine phosphatase family protein [Bacteroidales bacterium]MBP9588597.1 histidine phosphatase family protein [Bacteroidales bacterium]